MRIQQTLPNLSPNDDDDDDDSTKINHEMMTNMKVLPSTTIESEENTLSLTKDQPSPISNIVPLSPITSSLSSSSSSSPPSKIYTGSIISTKRQTGQVKFFSREKGFGFIIPDEDTGVDVFVHHTAIQGTRGVKGLAEYETVEYDLVQGPKGMQAINVTAPGGGPIIHRKPVSSSSGPFSTMMASTIPSMMNLNLLNNTGFGYQPIMTPEGLIGYVPITFSTTGGGDIPYLNMCSNQTSSNFPFDSLGDPVTSSFLRVIPQPTSFDSTTLPTTTTGRIFPSQPLPQSPPFPNHNTNSNGAANPNATIPSIMTTATTIPRGGGAGDGDTNHHTGQRMNGMMNGHHPNSFISGSMDVSSSLQFPAWYTGNQQHAYQMMAAVMAASNPTLNGMMSSMSQPHQQHPLQPMDSFPMVYMPTMQQQHTHNNNHIMEACLYFHH